MGCRREDQKGIKELVGEWIKNPMLYRKFIKFNTVYVLPLDFLLISCESFGREEKVFGDKILGKIG